MKKIQFLFFIFIFAFLPMFFVHAEPIKILLVPGHDNEIWGAQYGEMKEADMNLRLANGIYDLLKKDKRFEVFITRNWDGYIKEFANYFFTQKENIILFKENAKEKRRGEIFTGDFVEKNSVPHVTATQETAIKLYGINKWANENKMDAVIHIHFNDYPRETKWLMGIHKGFAIYMPEEQMINSEKSSILAKNIFDQLETKYITSTLYEEKGGFLKDQTLIALGSNGTLDANVGTVLIEYGYIYRFGDKFNRYAHYKSMADLTAKGIKNYFFK